MLRRVMLAFFALALGLSACGRQVTVDRSAGLSGEMTIKFRTSVPLDFAHVTYVIAFNTSGIGGEPYADVYATTLCNYSFEFAVGQRFGTTLPQLRQVYQPPGTSTFFFNDITLNPVTTNLQTGYGQNNEFTLVFARSQLNRQSPVANGSNPCPGSNPAPTSAPTPTPSGGATPTPVGTASPGPTATPTPAPTPTAFTAPIWYINFFTTNNGSGVPYDALGFGVTDVSYSLFVDTRVPSSQQIFRPPNVAQPANAAAYIAGGEVDNNP